MQSRLPDHVRICGNGKRVLRSKTRARQMAQFMSRANNDYLEAYRCEFCGAWHIGHPPYWKRMERK